MTEFSVSAEGALVIGNSIFDYLKRGQPSSYVPFISVIKIDIRNFSQQGLKENDADTLKPNIELPTSTGGDKSVVLRWTQREPLDSKTIANPNDGTLSRHMVLSRFIGLATSILVFEVVSETSYTSAAIQQWLDLLDALGRGSKYGTHWSPLPIIRIKRSETISHENSSLQRDRYLSTSCGPIPQKEGQQYDLNYSKTLCFSSVALQRALKLLMMDDGSFNGSQFLSKCLGGPQDWVRHFKKYAETSIQHINKHHMLESHIRLEGKCREIIYGSSFATHVSNIVNTIYDSLPIKPDLRLGTLLRSSDMLFEKHRQVILGFSADWPKTASARTCFSCLFRSPERILPCGHSICDRCIQLFGDRISQATFRFAIQACVLCNAKFQRIEFNLQPPSAGTRLLSLDGGGCRGVIVIEALKLISKALRNLGALILLKLLRGNNDTEQLMNEFKSLASKVFRPQKSIVSRLLGGVRALLTDEWMNSSFFNKLLKESLPIGKLFGGSLEDNSKIGVTTIRNDSIPCVLGNYNGAHYNENKGYEFLREDDPSKEVEVWEAGRCSAGVPGYFQPMHLAHKKAFFEDGGLRYNNPVALMISESKRIWDTQHSPDIVLSIGTGFVKSQEQQIPTSFFRNRSLLRVGRHFLASLCGETTWQNLEGVVTERYRERLHRINIELEIDEAGLDNPSSMNELILKTDRQLLGSPQILEIASILAASQFYFELDFVTASKRAVVCVGRILSRLEAGSTSLIDFTRKLKDSVFLVSNKTIKCVPETVLLSVVRGLPYERHVKFTLPANHDHKQLLDIRIQLCSQELEGRPISGFPIDLETLKTANNISRLQDRLNPSFVKSRARKRNSADSDLYDGHRHKKLKSENWYLTQRRNSASC
ncbi:hypothetical protein TWF788_003259 [Orbilia oligospora]|uniref:PNPLA domain-containing protein n=1 Tax=Orbilia oligospora TaxID=2813651 RepID=A0A7C8PZV7_ORBOL|nr:hypothetical protein TWF788_003259 [Orbilia oligospora]